MRRELRRCVGIHTGVNQCDFSEVSVWGAQVGGGEPEMDAPAEAMVTTTEVAARDDFDDQSEVPLPAAGGVGCWSV
jgi:hypothetical protein